ncbi:hypothetical protein COU80_00565 [Candidatus Peregrinibacteria bacterium CG10_big_fil_rev_8_21_14_0_10_55_24]|nr:MAG: hypothetical protein COU80_00565 [Candidatus Peregrinibacteria bacterium CG10_big_fil_rev_8_21_14_0_10_55_24]
MNTHFNWRGLLCSFGLTFTGLSALFLSLPQSILAAVYDGGGLQEGVNEAGNTGIGSADIRTTIIKIMLEIVSYTALLAVSVIILAGLYLILGFGDEGAKDKAKKIILYVGVGVLLILLAGAIVQFIKGLVL